MNMRNSPSRRSSGARRGNAVLEMILVLPVLLMLAFGIADYGYFFYVKNCVQQAAQAGARLAISSSSTNSKVTTLVSQMMTSAGLSSSGYTLTTTPSDIATASTGSAVTVTISISWANVGGHALASGYGGISNSKAITGTAVMYKEPT